MEVENPARDDMELGSGMVEPSSAGCVERASPALCHVTSVHASGANRGGLEQEGGRHCGPESDSCRWHGDGASIGSQENARWSTAIFKRRMGMQSPFEASAAATPTDIRAR